MTYHLDWTVFIFAHTIAEVLDRVGFSLAFAGATQVKDGDTVPWTNKDNYTHDVHRMGGLNWTSKPLATRG